MMFNKKKKDNISPLTLAKRCQKREKEEGTSQPLHVGHHYPSTIEHKGLQRKATRSKSAFD